MAEEFERAFGQAAQLVKQLKIKNEYLLRSGATRQNLLPKISADTKLIEQQTIRLRQITSRLQQNYLDPASVKKLQRLKIQAAKQIERNGTILKQLVESTFQDQSEKSDCDEAQVGELVKEVDNQVQLEMQAEKDNMIREVQSKIEEISGIMKESLKLTVEQGEQLVLITDNVNKTNSHVLQSYSEIGEANQTHKKYNKKSMVLVLIVLAVVLTIVLVLTV